MKCDAATNFMFVNGELFTPPDASIFERIEGDSLYEVVKLLEGIPLFFADHMARLDRSMALHGIKAHKSPSQVQREIDCLTGKTGCRNVNVKLVCHPGKEEPTFLTYLIAQDIPTAVEYRRGVHTILYSGERKNPHVKAVNTSYRERAAAAREGAGAYEALLVDNRGYITEGTRSNLFYLIDNELCTPPAESVLLGVTRQRVSMLCRQLGIPIEEKKLHRDDLDRLEAAFITGTSIDVLPVGSIGRKRLASGSHPTVKTIAAAFERHVAEYLSKKQRM